jgi:predicted O-linked N-acetylglucosamine transferase (SPINDLY family)
MNRKQRRAASSDRSPVPASTAGISVEDMFRTAVWHHGAGDHVRAEQLYRQILSRQPDHAKSLHYLGLILRQSGKRRVAIELLTRAATLTPRDFELQTNFGVVLKEQGQLDQAVAAFRQALAVKPDSAEAFTNLGNVLGDMGRPDEAIAALRQAVAIQPNLAAAHVNIGALLAATGQYDAAMAAYQQALAIDPNLAEVHCNIGVALWKLSRLDEAAAALRRAIALRPGLAEAYLNLADILGEQGRTDDAIALCQRAVAVNPRDANTHHYLGMALTDAGQLDKAAEAFRQAIALRPNFADAHANLGNVLRRQRHYEKETAAYRQAVHLRPEFPAALNTLYHLRRQLCDWDGLAAQEAKVLEAVRRQAKGITPFSVLSMASSHHDQLECARQWAAGIATQRAPLRVFRPRSRLRLGYLSADFRNHPVACLMVELIERHDRDRFEVFGYSYGPDDGSAMRHRLTDAFDHFTDISATSHADAAYRIRHDDIDILIDLTGYTQYARPQIAALRPAPIQVNFLGYPGTMGADFIDYLIADPFVVPMDQQAYFSERLVHLPSCYQPNDSRREIGEHTPSRAECGLPDQGLVFCCFNNSYKITPEMFALWMRLLARVPGSVLWLLEASATAQDNLRRAAARQGVDPSRLVFAPKRPLAEHLARHRLADLVLDTLPYNAHTTASDALWAGVPVLTCAGKTFASRVAGSLLHAVGLPDLVTTSLAEYETLALCLANDPAARAGLRDHLRRNHTNAPLFDIGRFTMDLEFAYSHMWDLRRQGRPPQAFAVAAERLAEEQMVAAQ